MMAFRSRIDSFLTLVEPSLSPALNAPDITATISLFGGQMPNSCLFDHLVGASEQRQGHSKTKCFRGLEVDNQLDFRGLLHRKIGRFLAFEHPTGIDSQQLVRIWNIASVAHQAAGHGELT